MTTSAPFLRSASAADLPPGYRWLSADESTASQDRLWDLSLAKWVPITPAFTGLHVRHFTSVIRPAPALSYPDDCELAPAWAAPEQDLPANHTTPEQAAAQGYKSITSPFTSFQAYLLKEMSDGLKARNAPHLIVTLSNGLHEIWIPKKKPKLKHQL